jgi:hypothetical protein
MLRCDSNKNGVLNSEEIEDWLLKQVNEHLDTAKNQNNNLFDLMDTDKNGKLKFIDICMKFHYTLIMLFVKGLIFWDEYNEIYERLHGISKDTEDAPPNIDESE